ncbi:bifunctional ornithine acetyltransferase/N-acetylglutamate synthase [Calderihabitans maritimus]|nr:bifunctional ornithine acetyltransferase/N-acetylglutamate synthase [Calderihabitans maritimus]
MRPADYEVISGGVTAVPGTLASGVSCGLKEKGKDLALVCMDKIAAAAAVFTTNRVKAAPVMVSQEHLKGGVAQAIVVNSGNANACTGVEGLQDARRMAEITAQKLNILPRHVVVASTGVIGVPLPMDKIETGIERAVAELSPQGGRAAAEAIMTTDTCVKEYALRTEIGGREVTVGGMAKGAGMIHPNMATMLAFITTDLNISSKSLRKALSTTVDRSFNMITVDGDTSTNDMVVLLANGLAGNPVLQEFGNGWQEFLDALEHVCVELAKMIARDGEGATKLVEVRVLNAQSAEEARKAARAIAASNLVKTALFGNDANWGRIMAALGYSGAQFNPDLVEVSFASNAGREVVAMNGRGINFSEERVENILRNDTVQLIVDLKEGEAEATAWTCDLSYDYVRINADYRT